MIKKLLDSFSKKSYGSTQTSFIGNNFLSCGNVLLNQNDKYKFLKTNSDVRRCNDYISKKVGLNGLLLVDKDGNELTPEEKPEEYEYLNRLFKDQTWLRWKKQVFTNTNISGENYFQPVEGVTNGGKITRFETIDTRAILKEFNDNGDVSGFSVIPVGYGKAQTISTNDIGYYTYEDDPINIGYGFGVIDGIIFDILADREAGKTNYYTFENGGIPGAIFTLDESINDKDQIKQAAEELVNKFQGSSNVNKVAASPFIKDVKVLNISNKDLEYIGGRKFSSEKIASAFGLHLKLIGYQGENGSYSEIVEIRKEINDTTIKGFESYLENIINDLIDKFSDSLEIDLSEYTVKLVSESFDNEQLRHEAQREDYKLGLKTANEILTERGLPEAEDSEYGNARYIANNLTKVGESQEINTNDK